MSIVEALEQVVLASLPILRASGAGETPRRGSLQSRSLSPPPLVTGLTRARAVSRDSSTYICTSEPGDVRMAYYDRRREVT